MTWVRWVGRMLPWVGLAGMLSGCQTAAYYAQAARGQWQILAQREPVSKCLADPGRPADLKRQLELVLSLREFAGRELKLPPDGHYLSYVELGRDHVVWNVQAAPEFSLEERTWWYPVVGSLSYRGFFSESRARACGDALAARGLDVYVDGVDAYSTLGWFKDPVLSSFVRYPEVQLAAVIFHELAHQRLFVAGDADFNEAFATAVEQAGVRRWLG
jgi:predicted aminopeptidase